MNKRILAIILALVIIIMIPTTVFGDKPENSEADLNSARDNRIMELIDLRTHYIVFGDECVDSEARISEINNQLAALGFEEITAQEANQVCSHTQNRGIKPKPGINPKAGVPSSSRVTFNNYRSTVTSGGVQYNIQRIVVTPKANVSSGLSIVGSKTQTYNKDFTAGAVNAIKCIAWAVVSSSSPLANVLVTIKDAFTGFISGISPSYIVHVNSTQYTWTLGMTVVFTFVRKASDPDDRQILSLISTKIASGKIGWQYPTSSYKKTSTSAYVEVRDIVQGKKDLTATPTYFDSNSKAIAQFKVNLNPYYAQVKEIDLKGPDGKVFYTVSPVQPDAPRDVAY